MLSIPARHSSRHSSRHPIASHRTMSAPMPQPTSSLVSNILSSTFEQRCFSITLEALKPIDESSTTQDVYRANLRGTPVVVKRIPAISPYDVSTGVQTLYQMRHPNIALFMGAGLGDDGNVYLVSEHLERGNLRDLMAIKSLSWRNDFSSLLVQVCHAMMYLHAKSLRAGSNVLTTSNVCVARNWTAKLVDVDSIQRRAYGQEWIAPEVLQGGSYSVRSDLYSFGVILKKLCLTLPVPVSMEALYLECLDADPCARPPFSMVVKLIEQSKAEVQPEPTLVEL